MTIDHFGNGCGPVGGQQCHGVFRWSGLRKVTYSARPSATSGWLPALLPGQRVQLVHGIKAGQISFEVRYQANGGARDEAERSANGLSRDLKFALAAAFDGYKFAHTVGDTHRETGSWPRHYAFQPEACRVAIGRAMGISAVDRRFEYLRLAADRNRRRDDFVRELVTVARNVEGDLEVVVDIEARHLTNQELQVVALALGSLYSPDRVTSDREPFLPIQSAPLSAALAGQLEQWMERRQGHQLTLSVFAEAKVSAALLDSLAASVFHGMSGRWTTRNDASIIEQAGNDGVLDLVACRPLGSPAPAIAPPPDYFLAAGHAEALAPHPGALPEAGILLGRTGMGEREEPVRFAGRDRSRHCYIIGATGTGKSTLILNMVLQDIRDGAGVCVLDPHGDLHAELVRAVPSSRAADVIPIDLADAERAIGLNLLESRGTTARQQVSFAINEILSMFWMLYAAIPEAMGPAFEQYMRNTLMVLAQNSRGPGTVADVVPFYEDSVFRSRWLESCTNPVPVSFFQRLAQKTTGEAGFQNMAPYITNKLNRFVGSDFVRPIIGQSRSTLDFRECMDQGKVLLVNLNKGVLGDVECRLVGMLLLAKVFSAALERASQPTASRRIFHLYVDEAQNFLTPIVGSILAEARKFGLTMTLANQNLAQWAGGSSRSLLEAILGNVGSQLLFRVGPEDAQRLSSFTRPEYDVRDLQYLPDRTVVARLLANGRPLPPFTFETMPPIAETEIGVDEVLMARLRQNFESHSMSRDEVEQEIRRRHDMARSAAADAPGDSVARVQT